MRKLIVIMKLWKSRTLEFVFKGNMVDPIQLVMIVVLQRGDLLPLSHMILVDSVSFVRFLATVFITQLLANAARQVWSQVHCLCGKKPWAVMKNQQMLQMPSLIALRRWFKQRLHVFQHIAAGCMNTELCVTWDLNESMLV
ncbi:Uncharacterized protein TCM_030003 [Theobroma cacao]|uniref:Uncharacterized protein n=1 Tax=Theobroma cacao TaxID=3641 RepID=A0A061GEX0_THECC|nr:Uncharacterized protein TCM_030003 [Theobroma cacao]